MASLAGQSGPAAPGDAGPFGLIAGQGSLPLIVARGIKQAGHRLVVVALTGQAAPVWDSVAASGNVGVPGNRPRIE